ncbi:MAG TPA: hypothetical protein VF097_04165 [Actinomycetota bacterium]
MRGSRLRWLIPTVVLISIVLIPLLAWGQTPPPGEEPEVVRPWTWWLAIPLALAVLGLVALIALRYVRFSPRFFGKEEAPKIPERPRAYAGVNAPAYPAPAPQPLPAAAPAAAARPAATTATAEAPAPAQAPAAEPEPESQPEPAADAQAPEKEAEPSGEGDDVYERVLKEQLDKGVSPKVAEGRAKAAAHRARRSG